MRVTRMAAALCSVMVVGAVLTAQPRGGQTPAAGAPAASFDPKADPVQDLAKAVEDATRTHRRIILDVGGEWCGWCHALDRFYAAHADLSAVRDKHYVWMKVNWSPDNKNTAFLSKYPAISGYPHLFVLEHDGTLLQSQDTSPLEDGGSSYNLDRMTEFLQKWASKS
jgi:thiol:disulfide interchange protein